MKIIENKIKFSRGENYNIPDNADVKLTMSDKKIILKNSWRLPVNFSKFKRISSRTYLNKDDGEIYYYKRRNFKSKETIRKNMKKLELLIKLYFTNKRDNIIFITLTCKDNVQDMEIMRIYTRKFLRKLKGKYSQYDFMYIYKFERQLRGSWHTHILIKDTNNKKIFLPYDELTKLWKFGNIYLQTVKEGFIDPYYNKKIYDENSYDNHPKEKLLKYMCKTTQLYGVPNGKQIYGKSNNIKVKTIRTKNYQAKEMIKNEGAELYKESTILVQDTETNIIRNKHKTEEYNRKLNLYQIKKV